MTGGPTESEDSGCKKVARITALLYVTVVVMAFSSIHTPFSSLAIDKNLNILP